MFDILHRNIVQVNLDTSGYDRVNGVIKGSSGEEFLSTKELNSLVFTYEGFRFTKVLGIPVPSSGNSGQCTYEARFPRSGSGGTGNLQITMKLLQPVGDDCFKADTLLPKGSLGLPIHTENIRIQSESVEAAVAKGIEQDFLNRNYDLVVAKGESILKLNSRNLEEAIALFYWIGSYVMQNDLTKHKNSILSLLDVFFTRGYDDSVEREGEYQKIDAYLREVAKKVGYEVKSV